MNTDFLDAHERHWEDAELLKASTRLANADHLYGVSAECGLKRLMEAFGMRISSGKPLDRADQVHANRIWDRFEAYRSGHVLGPNYVLPSVNPFAVWDVNQRYVSRSCFAEAVVEEHRQGAEVVKKLIEKARMGGTI
jgi:hypothetical protein